jgi:NAD(P)-dependent dehydrogenase (short-subunit alcohol dehydrogenase family)
MLCCAPTVESFGGVDLLVNNAAYRRKGAFLSLTVEEWDRMHAVIARGTFLCMRDTIRQMRRQGRGGAIVNVSTIGAAHPTIFNNAHYDSAKSGVNALTRSCAIEFAADGIRINAVMPGGVDTEGMKKMRLSTDSGYVSQGPMTLPGRMPMGVALPIQLASAILFLASPASSYMTGHVMAVDGGYLVS